METNRNFEKYKKSLVDGREVYYRGRKVEDVTKHPITSLEVDTMRHFFEKKFLYDDPELGAETSKFYKVPRTSSDLLERWQLTYEITKDAGVLMPHIGSDALFATMIVINDMDEYRERITSYAQDVAKDNLFLAVAQIDVKGHRQLRPLQQEDPDVHVHVVDEKPDGVIVRGAKMHTTYSLVSNEILVLPGRGLRKGEEDYAICFAVPTNARGLKLISRPATATEAALHDLEGPRTKKVTHVESLTIFNNVFVPWERVFVHKDVERGTRLALLFALWHRLSAVSYRAGLAEYLVGLGKLVAEANGIDEVPHIQKDMVDLIAFAEIQKLCAKMAAYECTKDDGTGIAIPNAIYTNIGKLYSNENYLNVMRSLIDIGGGLIVAAPSGDDYANEELRRDINKYLRGAIPGEERFKLFLLLREAISLLGGEESVIHIHAEGSIRASLIELYRTYNFDEPKRIIGKLLSQIK